MKDTIVEVLVLMYIKNEAAFVYVLLGLLDVGVDTGRDRGSQQALQCVQFLLQAWGIGRRVGKF